MKKKGAFLTVCVGMLLAGFLLLNQIVAACFPKYLAVRKVDFNDYQSIGKAYFHLLSYEINEKDLKETITLTGWAFAETEEDNSLKRGNLILKGRKNTYMTSELSFFFSSIQNEVSDWKEIQGSSNNFAVTFSTVNLPPDDYEIYVYVEENENNRGIVDTGAGFRKNGVRMKNYTSVTFCGVPDVSTIDTRFDDGWWNLSSCDSYFKITGWQIKKGITSENFTYYGIFVGENGDVLSFKLPGENYTSLAEQFGDAKYISSGFNGCVDYSKLPDTCGYAYIAAECDGQWYRTEGSGFEIPQKNG